MCKKCHVWPIAVPLTKTIVNAKCNSMYCELYLLGNTTERRVDKHGGKNGCCLFHFEDDVTRFCQSTTYQCST